MDRSIPTVITAVVLAGLLVLMWRSWRARVRRDGGQAAGYPLPAVEAPVMASANAFYVATTPRARPLERLGIRGLGFRARAALTVTEAGLVLVIPGEEAVFIPASAIDLLAPATWTIDRVVETDGLLVLGWRLHETAATPAGTGGGYPVDSYFRIVDPAEAGRIDDAIRSIAAGAVGAAARDESEA
jgi:hypothetical protein